MPQMPPLSPTMAVQPRPIATHSPAPTVENSQTNATGSVPYLQLHFCECFN